MDLLRKYQSKQKASIIMMLAFLCVRYSLYVSSFRCRFEIHFWHFKYGLDIEIRRYDLAPQDSRTTSFVFINELVTGSPLMSSTSLSTSNTPAAVESCRHVVNAGLV